MAKKKRRMRVGAKTATKAQERDVIEKARAVRKNPDLIFPECGNANCKKCVFKKSKQKVEKVHKSADDVKKLMAYSNSGFIGDERAKAYAATLVVSHTDKAPFLARAQTPFGEATFAIRGKARKEFLIGIQHFDDQGLRVSHLLSDVTKNNLHIYSNKNKMVCTGKVAKPPAEYINERISALKVDLKKQDSNYSCAHINVEKALNEEPAGISYVLIRWKSVGISIVICKDCAAKSKENTIVTLAKYIAAQDALSDFNATVVGKGLTCAEQCETCALSSHLTSTISGADYVKENESDNAIIKKYEEKQREIDENIFIIGDTCYGTNLEKFVQDIIANSRSPESLDAMGSSAERTFVDGVLIPVLKKVSKPIILEHASLNKLLASVWKDLGREMIGIDIDDDVEIEELYQRGLDTPDDTTKILREAQEWAHRKSILNALPVYERRHPIAAFADDVAKAYKTKGADAAEKVVLAHQSSADENIKILSYSFLLALGKEKGKEWQYNKNQQESGIVLEEYAKMLLESGPEKYTEALQRLIAATGSTEILKPKN